MTPEEVFAQLRDIHTPEAAFAAGRFLDLRPIIAFLAVLAVVIAARRLRARWRARRALSEIDQTAAPSEQRDAIARMLATAPRLRPGDAPPAALFDPPEEVGAEAVAQLRHWAARRLR